MPPLPQGQRIDQLFEEVKKLKELIDELFGEINNLQSEAKEGGKLVAQQAEKLREFETRLLLSNQELTALGQLKQQPVGIAELREQIIIVRNADIGFVKKDIESLQKWREKTEQDQEEWGKKKWMILPPLLAAVLTGVISYIIHLIFQRP